MEFIKVLILGVVEGITEFLPISSTGHLILVHQWLHLDPVEFQNAFDVIIQLGAIFSVVVLYWNRLWPWSSKNEQGRQKTKSEKNKSLRLWAKVIIGVIPAGVLGFLFDDYIDAHFFSPKIVAFALIFWGVVIILLERREKPYLPIEDVDDITLKQAFLIGLFQCLAMIPGTSRSAATIIGATLLGTKRVPAAEFSFYLAIPTMAGATLLKVVKNIGAFSPAQWVLILVGSIVSYITAILVIRTFMKYIKNHSFAPFGVYRIVLGIFVFLYLAM